MEWCHKEEMRKQKADHDQLEAHIRCPQGEKHSTHTLPKRIQAKSHHQRTINTTDDLSLSYMHCPVGRTTHRHHFVHHIMEADIPLG